MDITPQTYARWRESRLGSLTEKLERENVFSLAGDIRGLKVLDVGCGDGTYAIEASQRGGNVFGLDRSLPMLEAARGRAIPSAAVIGWCQGAAQSLPFRDASFDLVLAVTSLCWALEPVLVLKEVHRVLRPDGVVLIGELGRWSCWALARTVKGWLGSPAWRGAHFRTAAELRTHLVHAGMRVSDIRGAIYYPPWKTAAQMMSRVDGALARLGSCGAAFIVVRSTKGQPLASAGGRTPGRRGSTAP